MTSIEEDVPDTTRALLSLLYQSSDSRVEELKRSGRRFAHYTSAENALSILSGRSIWLRNAAVMNDHSEIEHGRGILNRLLGGALGSRLFKALDDVHADISLTIRQRYHQEAYFAREQTFMMSLCEHDHDDWLGQLSMWRAYGGSRASVALIFKPEIIFDPSVSLDLYSSPVLYGGDNEMAAELLKVVEALESSTATIAAVDPDMVIHIVAAALHFALLSTKHPGFREEREWRILSLARDLSANAWVKSAVRSIGGIPQIIQIMPLHGHGSTLPCNQVTMDQAMDSEDITYLPQFAWDNLIDRIIIGPSLYPETIKAAIEAQLRADGASLWDQLVSVSEIPLRHPG